MSSTICIGGSTNKIFRCTPPYGTQFFRFHIHFHQKAPMLEVHAPPKWVHAPLREILDPPLIWTNLFRQMASTVLKLILYISHFSYSNRALVGLSDQHQKSDFRWLNNDPLYHNKWDTTKPNSQWSKSYAGIELTSLYDVGCSSVRAHLCSDIGEYTLVFRVFYERPMVIDSLNLKLRQIARFSSNVILDEMSSAKCHMLFGFFFLISQHEERPLYHVHVVISRCSRYCKIRLDILLGQHGSVVLVLLLFCFYFSTQLYKS